MSGFSCALRWAGIGLAALALAMPPRCARADAPPLRLPAADFRAVWWDALTTDRDAPARADLAARHADLLAEVAREWTIEGLHARVEGDVSRGRALEEAAAATVRYLSDVGFARHLQARVAALRVASRAALLERIEIERALRLAETLFERARYAAVERPARRALALSDAQGDALARFRALHLLGSAATEEARYDDAAAHFTRARDDAHADGSRAVLAGSLARLGEIHDRRKDRARAFALYEQALAIARVPEDWPIAGRILRQQGDLEVERGDFDRARERYERALDLAQRADDAAHMAEYRDYLGYLNRRLGDYERAASHHERALELAGRIADPRRRDRSLARSLHHLGFCTRHLAVVARERGERDVARRELRRAIVYARDAAALVDRAGDARRQGGLLRTLAFHYRELAELADPAGAPRHLRESRALSSRALEVASAAGHRAGVGLALHHLGIAQARLGERAAASESFARADEVWAEVGDIRSRAFLDRLRAKELLADDAGESVRLFDRAIERYASVEALDDLVTTYVERGRALETAGDLDRARAAYERAIDVLESVRGRMGSSRERATFLSRRLEPYEALVALLVRLHARGDVDAGVRAFDVSERARGRAMLELLQSASARIAAGVDGTLLDREERLRAELHEATRALWSTRDVEQRAALRDRIARLEREAGELEDRLERTHPRYAHLKRPRPISLDALAREVLGPREVLLEYFVTPGATFLFVVDARGLRDIHTIALGRADLAHRVEALRAPMEAVKRGSAPGLPEFPVALAHELYRALVAPAAEALARSQSALVVPHGPLFYLPFEALVTDMPEGAPRPTAPSDLAGVRYVLDSAPPLSYALSASSLDPRLHRDRRTGSANETVLAFGNPTYAAGGAAGSARLPAHPGRSGDALPPLPHAEAEVRALADMYGAAARVYLRGEATKERFVAESGPYRSLHMATHGILNERNPMFSGVVFAPDARDRYALLEAHEVFDLELDARLVVLSACELGLGRLERGEGLVGLGRAFLYAGAESLVVSLWVVDDAATGELMPSFFRGLHAGVGETASALRDAKRSLARSDANAARAHPFYWAPFVLVRGPQPVIDGRAAREDPRDPDGDRALDERTRGSGDSAQVELDAPGSLDLFRPLALDGAEISPDGRVVALRKPWNGAPNVFVRAFGDDGTSDRRLTDVDGRGIPWFVFASDETIVYLRDDRGDESYRLYAVSVRGGASRALTPFARGQAHLLSVLPHEPHHVLVALRERDPRVADVVRIDLRTGERELVARNPGAITQWVADGLGRVRAAIAVEGDARELWHRASEDLPFRSVARARQGERLMPFRFTADDRRIVLSSSVGRDRAAIVELDPDTGVCLERYAREDVDVWRVAAFPFAGEVSGAVFDTWVREQVFFDAALERAQRAIRRQLAAHFEIVSVSAKKDRLVVRTRDDRSPGAYYTYDVAAASLAHVGARAPWIDRETMAEMRAISFTARDEKRIHGYLTIPNDAGAAPLPLVVHPHGGPWTRTSWGFDPEVQLLARGGFAVLQVDYRGSTGYGRAFLEAGFGEWGRRMQDDLTDGVAHLVAQGTVDPERVCIFGRSYGGFAALAGLAFTPELYACGVSYVGIADPRSFLENLPPFWQTERELWFARVGHPVHDRAALDAISPLVHANRIRAPLLVAHGARDPRVPVEQARRLVEALRASGRSVEYLEIADEGHGFTRLESRARFHLALARFLRRHLGGGGARVVEAGRDRDTPAELPHAPARALDPL